MVNLVVSLAIMGGPGVFMNVLVREHRALNNQIFRCGEVSITYKKFHIVFDVAAHGQYSLECNVWRTMTAAGMIRQDVFPSLFAAILMILKYVWFLDIIQHLLFKREYTI